MCSIPPAGHFFVPTVFGMGNFCPDEIGKGYFGGHLGGFAEVCLARYS